MANNEPAISRNEFLSRAACAALTGLLSNPVAHEEHIRWEDLSAEAWLIADKMLEAAPAEFSAELPTEAS